MSEFLQSPMLTHISAFAVPMALSGIGICIVALLTARLLRRRSESLRYGILFTGVLGLLAIPALVGVGQFLPPDWIRAAAPPGDETVKIPVELLSEILNPPIDAARDGSQVTETQAISIAGPAFATALLSLWTIGVALGAIRLARAFCKQRRLVVGQPWCADFWTEELQARLAAKLGLRKFPHVLVSPAAPMPMVVGVWRPKIILPDPAPATWCRPQWEAVLLHEAAHIARRDPWAGLAQRLAVILFWWCPLTHMLSRRLSELREIICDDCALLGPCDGVAYAETLVESAERLLNVRTSLVPVGLLHSARGGLEARITRLLAQEKRPMTKLSLPGKLLGGAFLITVGLLTTAGTALSGGQSQPPRKIQVKILVDGKEIDLNDPKLGGLIEAANPQAKAEARFVPVELPVEARFIPLVAQVKIADGQKVLGDGLVAQVTTTAQTDPRIEELVKQAEAIKPGSGAAVRSALQGDAKAAYRADVRFVPDTRTVLSGGADKVIRVWDAQTHAVRPVEKPPTAGYAVVQSAPDQKIIILTIQDGKVQQLSEQEAKRLLERHVYSIRTEPPKTTDKKAEVIIERKAIAVPARVETVPMTPSPAADMDSLRRQLERLTAELNELRRRLDSGKK
jgi:beta-lactamase regulating signal transducer with metallopeptidase domain